VLTRTNPAATVREITHPTQSAAGGARGPTVDKPFHFMNEKSQPLDIPHNRKLSARGHLPTLPLRANCHETEATMIVYGISTCDTTKAAIKSLTKAGKSPAFRDVRANPLSPAEIDAIVTEFGDRAVNKQSTTYRSFSPFLREAEPEAQIAAQPAVMKRPVIQDGSSWSIGWDAAIEAKLTA
jgi:arsenate reductase-like glutaredoxin family protein